MNTTEIKKMFVKEFYKPTYKSWRVLEERAGKDIVGAEYEKYREKFYTKLGFTVVSGKKVFGTDYDCDTAVELNGKTVILEEDKAHYVDNCFLTRALLNAAEVMQSCINNDYEPPWFILSCATKMNNYQDIFEKRVSLLREDIQELVREKFLYFPMCQHGRVKADNYFQTSQNCFEFDDNLIEEQLDFLEGVKSGK
jgi:hypothetical protein